MKKLVLAATMLMFGASSIFAQDLTSKKGENYLPEEGDWAIGMDAVPFLNYAGNFFGKTGPNNEANNLWVPSNPNLALTGKYFLSEGKAIRGGIRLGFGSNTESITVANLSSTANWPATPTVLNTWKSSYTQFGLNGGLEWRKGNTRLQGFYGAELGFMVSSSSDNYTYGNKLNVADGIGITGGDAFESNIGSTVDGNGNTVDTRMLSHKSGTNFSLGLRGFVGAEYFVLPKLSLGGELGWGLGMNFGGQSTTTVEAIGERSGQAASVETITTEGNKGSNFGVDGSLINPLFGPAGRLNITFHF